MDAVIADPPYCSGGMTAKKMQNPEGFAEMPHAGESPDGEALRAARLKQRQPLLQAALRRCGGGCADPAISASSSKERFSVATSETPFLQQFKPTLVIYVAWRRSDRCICVDWVLL